MGILDSRRELRCIAPAIRKENDLSLFFARQLLSDPMGEKLGDFLKTGAEMTDWRARVFLRVRGSVPRIIATGTVFWLLRTRMEVELRKPTGFGFF